MEFAGRVVKGLVAASVVLYVVALLMPALDNGGGDPITGWACLTQGYILPTAWFPNPLLLLGWIGIWRLGRWGALPAVAAFGLAVYTLWNSVPPGSGMLVGAYLWLASLLVTTAAIPLLFSIHRFANKTGASRRRSRPAYF